MTCEEAIKYLSGLPPYCEDCEFNLNECDGLGSDCKIAEANRIAIEAIEKQIPKKPIEKDTEKPCLYCPACGVELFVENHHCKCGQAIDWSDE